MSPQTFRREEEEESGPEDSPPKKVFEDEEGNPICFFLHKSITSDWQRQNLIHAIESNGGFVQPDDSAVDTVLVDVKSRACNKDNLQLAYNAHSNRSKRRTWVEPMSFVSRCIKERAVRHAQREPKGMGGSLGDRTPFTDEDDDNLARYLAIRIPNIEKGGRRGNRVYKELCLMMLTWKWRSQNVNKLIVCNENTEGGNGETTQEKKLENNLEIFRRGVALTLLQIPLKIVQKSGTPPTEREKRGR
ncbi:hypothetical protein C0989_003032 [Termitomyces sp. Mn162]|nr:hypothetical protein C0989_003032 [Termitomyces sp. Mn162]